MSMVLRPGRFSYKTDGASFDGINDLISRVSLTGSADGKQGLIAGLFNFTGGDGTLQLLYNIKNAATFEFRFEKTSGNKFHVQGFGPAGTIHLDLTGATSVTASSGWVHFMSSWNLATTTAQMYLNGVDDLAGGSTVTDADIVGTGNAFSVGAYTDTNNKASVDMADLYIKQSYLALTSEPNRALLLNADGSPRAWARILDDLGTPLLGLHLDDDETANNFADNEDGNGEALTVTGALATASTSPTD